MGVLIGCLLVALANLSWGFANTVMTIAFYDVPQPMYLSEVRYVFSFLICLVLVCFYEGFPAISTFKREHIYPMVALSVAICGYNACYWFAVLLTDPVTAGLWPCFSPFFSLVFGICLGIEKFEWVVFLSLIVSFTGTMFQEFFDAPTADDLDRSNKGMFSFILGNVLSIIYTISYPMYYYYAKMLNSDFKPLFITSIGFGGYVFLGIPLIILEYYSKTTYTFSFNLRTASCVAFWVVFGSIVPYILSIIATKWISTTTNVAFAALTPLGALLMNIIVISITSAPHFELKGWDYGNLGLIAVAVGLYLLATSQKNKSSEKADESTSLLENDDSASNLSKGSKRV